MKQNMFVNIVAAIAVAFILNIVASLTANAQDVDYYGPCVKTAQYGYDTHTRNLTHVREYLRSEFGQECHASSQYVGQQWPLEYFGNTSNATYRMTTISAEELYFCIDGRPIYRSECCNRFGKKVDAQEASSSCAASADTSSSGGGCDFSSAAGTFCGQFAQRFVSGIGGGSQSQGCFSSQPVEIIREKTIIRDREIPVPQAATPASTNLYLTVKNDSSSISTVGTTTTVGATGGSVTAPPAPVQVVKPAPVAVATPCPSPSAANTTGDPNHPILTATGGSTGYSTDPNGNPVATANPSPTPLPVETRDAARAAASKTKVAAQPAKVANATSSVATPATAENRSAVLASTPRTAAVVKPTVASTTSAQPKGIQAKYGLNNNQTAKFAALRQTNGGLAAQVRAKLAQGQPFGQAYRGAVAGNTGSNSLRGAVQRNLGRSMRNTSASNVRPAVQRQTRSFQMSAPRQQVRAGGGGHGRR